MLDRSEMDAKQKKYVSDIRKSSGALLEIINDILDFSKIEAGKMEIHKKNFSLGALIDNLHSMFQVFCREKQLEMRLVASDNLPKIIFCDELRLRQILTNLLSNAVKYTEKGCVSLYARREGDDLHFAVKDTGIGISGGGRKKLFEPFVRLDVKGSKNIPGTGLGLSITYKLCKIMGGDLWYDSEYGKGSVFYVRIPFERASERIIAEDAVVEEFTAPEAKILIVDDIDINLSVAEALLSTFEIVPDLAMSGKEAIEFAEKKRYDMIFMDHMMPEMDGIETTTRIRGLGGWNDEVPIVALTANAITGMEQVFLENRMDDFLPKPVNINALNICLKKWLSSEIWAPRAPAQS